VTDLFAPTVSIAEKPRLEGALTGVGCPLLHFGKAAYFHSSVYYKAVPISYLQKGIQINSLIVRDVSEAFPELR
jgi:hypothetical protein